MFRRDALSHVWDFVQAVRHYWGSLVTGGSFIGAIGVWQATGHHVPASLYWGIALFALFVAFFKAWDEERKAREIAETALEQEQEAKQSASQESPQQGALRSQEAWLDLYREKQKLEDELESLAMPEPPPSLKDVPINEIGGLGHLRYMTHLEDYQLRRKDRKMTRIKKELELIEERLKIAPKHSDLSS